MLFKCCHLLSIGITNFKQLITCHLTYHHRLPLSDTLITLLCTLLEPHFHLLTHHFTARLVSGDLWVHKHVDLELEFSFTRGSWLLRLFNSSLFFCCSRLRCCWFPACQASKWVKCLFLSHCSCCGDVSLLQTDECSITALSYFSADTFFHVFWMFRRVGCKTFACLSVGRSRHHAAERNNNAGGFS